MNARPRSELEEVLTLSEPLGDWGIEKRRRRRKSVAAWVTQKWHVDPACGGDFTSDSSKVKWAACLMHQRVYYLLRAHHTHGSNAMRENMIELRLNEINQPAAYFCKNN